MYSAGMQKSDLDSREYAGNPTGYNIPLRRPYKTDRAWGLISPQVYPQYIMAVAPILQYHIRSCI